ALETSTTALEAGGLSARRRPRRPSARGSTRRTGRPLSPPPCAQFLRTSTHKRNNCVLRRGELLDIRAKAANFTQFRGKPGLRKSGPHFALWRVARPCRSGESERRQS